VTLGQSVTDPREVLRRALAERPTVTGFLEALTGEPVVADVISQRMVAPDPDDGLAVDGDRKVIRRIARLRGRGGTAYLYADTAFVPARLPVSARRRLAHGSDPIGRVLVDEGLHPVQLPAAGPATPHSAGPPALEGAEAVVWCRAYRLALGGRPVFAIREWFLRPVLDALAISAERRGAGPPRFPSP
jgi:chorismate-pyruvate lyase